jgi:hypothetical protein
VCTSVVLVCGQGDADGVAGTLMKSPGTAVVGHEFDGHVVRRWVCILRHGEPSRTGAAWPPAMTNSPSPTAPRHSWQLSAHGYDI